jgi:transcriptional regulator with XRE-family HTH domain
VQNRAELIVNQRKWCYAVIDAARSMSDVDCMEEVMIRARLIEAREKRGWTQELLAERVGVDVATIRRWEHGNTSPQGRNIWKLMEILGVASEDDLDLGRRTPEKSESVLRSLTRHSCVVRLVIAVFSDTRGVFELQDTIREILEGLTMDISRREALYTLAALPLATFSTLHVEKSDDEVLRKLAAGIAACEQLSRGTATDMREASKVLTSYLPQLQTIARSSPSSKLRTQAAKLTTQVYIRKAVLATHLTGTRLALTHAGQSVEYAKASGEVGLMISALVWHAWALFSDGQASNAMDVALHAKYLVESTDGLSALTCSSVYAVAAKYQALNGSRYKSEALKTLHQARDKFEDAGKYNDKSMYMDNSLDVFMLVDGMVHYYSGDATSAYAVFSQVIDPDSVQPKIAFSSKRLEIEAINDLTLASLKLPGPKKDKARSIQLWRAGLQGAIDLRSEQRFNEVVIAHHIMEALWDDDKDVKELRELLVHW